MELSEHFNLQITDSGDAQSHLAVRLDHSSKTGDRPLAILYLHGFGSQQNGEKADFFRSRAVASGLAFCSFDFQGHGESGGTMLELTLSRNIEDTRQVHEELRHRGFEGVVIFGSSMGGITGLWYSAIYPDNVLAGLHLAPALGLVESLQDWLGAEAVERWQRDGKLRVENELGAWDLSWNFVEDFRSFELERLKSLYRTPSLLLQGKLDDRVDWRQVLDFAVGCSFQEIELHLFADGDHRLIDRKQQLWSLVAGFLRQRRLID